jgi:hypothetical protein
VTRPPEPSVQPPRTWRERRNWTVSACSDSGTPSDDSKIFLTVSYEYRYKLCCIVNVTGKFVNKLGKPSRNGKGVETLRHLSSTCAGCLVSAAKLRRLCSDS